MVSQPGPEQVRTARRNTVSAPIKSQRIVLTRKDVLSGVEGYGQSVSIYQYFLDLSWADLCFSQTVLIETNWV
jgi:hypothetical protein